MKLEQLIQSDNGTIVDVRSHAEFSGGHVAGSVNIPLQEIGNRLDDLRVMHQPLILCCASGARSGQALRFLSLHGFESYNAGSWLNINYLKNNKL